MDGPPKIELGDWLIRLFTRRREIKRAVRDRLRSCETTLARFNCNTDHTPREAFELARTLGPDAERHVLLCSKPAALVVELARKRFAACRNTPGYSPDGRHFTRTHRRMLERYGECLGLLTLAESRLASLSTELRRMRMLIDELPTRMEAYDTQLGRLRRRVTAQFWNGTGSAQALSACDSATSFFVAAQLAWEKNEPFIVHRLLDMIEEPLGIMERSAAASES